MSPDQLQDELLKLKKEQFNLRFQRATGQLENTARVREVRTRHRAHQDTLRGRSPPQRRLRRQRCRSAYLQGVVVSDKHDKTVVVKVERRFTHPRHEEDRAPVEEVPRP